MKISKKVNSFFLHLLYLFMYFALSLSISILSDIYSSDTNKVEITSNYLLWNTPLAIFYWIYHTASGTLSKKFNLVYEKNQEEERVKKAKIPQTTE